MSVILINYPIYYCTCDTCKKRETVERTIVNNTYNGAQAVRSLGWSYGKDGKVLCDTCRRYNRNDHYRHNK